MKPETLYRFVKASERLPDFADMPDDFGIIFTNKKQVKTFTVYPSYTKNIPAMLQNELGGWEWLEPLPAAQSPSRQKGIPLGTVDTNDYTDFDQQAKNFHELKKAMEQVLELATFDTRFVFFHEKFKAIQKIAKQYLEESPVVVHEIITDSADFDRQLEEKNREIYYWQKRCEAAEEVIKVMNIPVNDGGDQWELFRERNGEYQTLIRQSLTAKRGE